MFPTNSERLIGISDAFSAFVYGYPSSCPRAHYCTPNKSVTTLRYTRRPGPIYTGHTCRHLRSAVPWISEDRLLTPLCVDSDWLSCRPMYSRSCCSFTETHIVILGEEVKVGWWWPVVELSRPTCFCFSVPYTSVCSMLLYVYGDRRDY